MTLTSKKVRMGLKRRDFLNGFGWALATLGVSQTGLLQLGNRYYQALAQSTGRRLALLVGINQYPYRNTLAGCLTDVELQRELLIHRFGFQSSDILTLIEQQATREQIENAFLHHLTEQAQPGDVVVIHFSGYGRRIQLEMSPETVFNSFVPVDSGAPSSGVSVVNDLLEDTLGLLLQTLLTDQVTTILDTSFSHLGNTLQGNLRIRTRPQLVVGQLSTDELAFQEKLRSQAILTPQSPHFTIPGVVIAAAGATQQATETQWAGFSAGVFTYALTQYLWQVTSPTTIYVSLRQVAGVLEQLGGNQQPALSGQKSQDKSVSAYNLTPTRFIGADGVVIGVEDNGKTGQLWLAGLPPQVLEYYGANSQLFLVPPDSPAPIANSDSLLVPNQPLKLQLRSRTGLTAKAQLVGNDSTTTIQVGQLVQEYLRVLPRNLNLLVALDTALARIERVDATSAFASIPYVSLTVAGEQPADYLFGRLETKVPDLSAPGATTTVSRYGLFSLGQQLIANTTGDPGEVVKIAVQRLIPKLRTLLAAKLWQLTINEASSRLGVQATLEVIAGEEKLILQQQTLRVPKKNMVEQPVDPKASITTLPIKSRIQYRVNNYSDRPVYLILLGLDSNKSAIILYPPKLRHDSNGSGERTNIQDVVILPGETLVLPRPSAFEWVIHGPTGLAETYLILSCAPFTRTLAVLQSAMHPTDDAERVGELRNPLEVAQAVLQDLSQASLLGVDSSTSIPDSYILDVSAWAGFSFIYQVV